MVKNSTLQKIIELNEDVLNEKLIEKSKLEMLIANINRSIEMIKNSLDLEASKMKNDDLNMIRSFSKYRELCSIKIKFLINELRLKESSLEHLKTEIKEAYIEKEKYNLVFQKKLLNEKKELERRELIIFDEVNLRNFITNKEI